MPPTWVEHDGRQWFRWQHHWGIVIPRRKGPPTYLWVDADDPRIPNDEPTGRTLF
jgi:hypothetical protein